MSEMQKLHSNFWTLFSTTIILHYIQKKKPLVDHGWISPPPPQIHTYTNFTLSLYTHSKEDKNTRGKQEVPGCEEHNCITVAQWLRKALRK